MWVSLPSLPLTCVGADVSFQGDTLGKALLAHMTLVRLPLGHRRRRGVGSHVVTTGALGERIFVEVT